MPASSPPRSTSRSTASTPTPPPLVKIARRLPDIVDTARQRFGGREQLVEIDHAQQAGAAERSVVDRIRAGQRAGMRQRRLRALRVPPGFDDQHRLNARRGPRRRHELAGVFDRFDVEQDRTRVAVKSEMVEQIGKIDIDAVANRNDGGKSNVARSRPLHQARCDGAGLRNQRKVAGRRRRGGKAGVEFCPRHQHAEAIGADQTHACSAGIFFAALGQRAGTVTEPGGDDDADRRPLARRRGNGIRHRGGRHRDSDDVRHLRQSVVGFDRANSFDCVVVRIDEMNRARESGAAKIFEYGPARLTFCAETHRRRRLIVARKASRDDRSTLINRSVGEAVSRYWKTARPLL